MTPSSLPIDAILPDLLLTLEQNTNAVLVAEPGAGKTTRVPLALLDASWREDGKIIVLEPRRLAARAAARRMAHTLGERVGETVGYRVRMDSKVSAKTRIEVVTEGVFTRMILDDPELSGVAAVLFDEYHERSMDGDLGLALALDVQGALREDLRIVPMSATLDAAEVSKLLDDAPILKSKGRQYPVETRYIGRDPRRRLEEQVQMLFVQHWPRTLARYWSSCRGKVRSSAHNPCWKGAWLPMWTLRRFMARWIARLRIWRFVLPHRAAERWC